MFRLLHALLGSACAVVAGFLFFLAGEPRVLRLSRDSLKSACAVVAGYNHGM